MTQIGGVVVLGEMEIKIADCGYLVKIRKHLCMLKLSPQCINQLHI